MKRSTKPAGRIRPECHRSTEEKALRAELDEIAFVVGPRVSEQSNIISGSKQFRCTECGEWTWISPTTIALSIKAPILCSPCAIRKMDEFREQGHEITGLRTDGKTVKESPLKWRNR